MEGSKSSQNMTYSEYLTWDPETRCEVLDGKIISMALSPIPEHQDISMQLSIEFGTFLRGKKCSVFAAPIDVYLFQDNNTKWDNGQVRNWLIPDLIVVCDPVKVRSNKILGAPDLVIEIISPSTAKIDRMDKRLAYQRAGVKEYWIIDPANQIIKVYILRGNALELENVYSREEQVPVKVLDGLVIEPAMIFPDRSMD